MTHEEQALVRILKQVKQSDHVWINKWFELSKKFGELCDPICESPEITINGKMYWCRREAFVSNYDGEINYGFTIYEWDGTEREQKLSPKSNKTFKWKNWVEIFHCVSLTKEDPKNIIMRNVR